MLQTTSSNKNSPAPELLEFSVEVDWKQELLFCEKLLNIDERNFHCWDHRRWVISQFGASKYHEFALTTKLITLNFSNYSAWHYRSNLLQELYIIGSNSSALLKTLQSELDLVNSACFTEPTDQSVWLYQKWLLSKVPLKVSPWVIYLWNTGNNLYILLILSEAFTDSIPIVCYINFQRTELSWAPLDRELQSHKHYFSSYELLPSQLETPYEVALFLEGHFSNEQFPLRVSLFRGSFWVKFFGGSLLAELSRGILEAQLEKCHQLFQMEPTCKWALLTVTLLRQQLFGDSDVNCLVTSLKKLREIDPYRANFYVDFSSEVSLWKMVKDALESGTQGEISLERLGISDLSKKLCLLLSGIQVLCLKSNSIRNMHNMRYLYMLRKLIVDDNKIEAVTVELRSLPFLVFFSAQNNLVTRLKGLEGFRDSGLREINLKGNPVTASPYYRALLLSYCYKLELLDNSSVV
ncbi:geranylgeranyl transferase type-2 subunit alpha-like [Zophobas morio]|uniref:geranylgeranyl transferase type-2 subunit alpha-like n=1 Tax=Zophobas morio TaxID=2755281 RepID=UPI003082E7D5